MESVQFNCPLCAGLFQIDPAMAGGQVLCPNCQGTVTIPELSPPPSGPPVSAASELSCPLCTGVFQVTPEMAGQQVSCPHCTGLVMIPRETPPSSAAPPPTGEIVAPAPQPPVPPAPPSGAPPSGYSPPAAPQAPPSPSNQPGAVGNQDLYPPGFAAKPAGPEQPATPSPSTPAPAAASDYRYPPGQAPKTSPQPAGESSDAASRASAPKTQDSPTPSNQPSSSVNRHLYPPGFEPKGGTSDTQSAPSTPASSAGDDFRYPPGQAPTSTPQPTAESSESSSKQSAPVTKSPPTNAPAKDISSLLPPGAPESSQPPQEIPNPADAKAEAMLPPGATAPAGSATTKRSEADALLPPGAETQQVDSELKQRALPDDEKNRPIKQSKDIVIPTEDGGVAQLHEPERTVSTATGKVRLRSISQEEKTRKRSLKSLIMWIICVLLLIFGLIVLVNI